MSKDLEDKNNNHSIHEKIGFDKLYNNYHKIIDKSMPYKFHTNVVLLVS